MDDKGLELIEKMYITKTHPLRKPYGCLVMGFILPGYVPANFI